MPESYNEKPLWGHWYLKELLGKGGYGAVYRAVREETVSGKPFIYEAAVKHISIPQDKSELDGAYDNGYVSDEQSAMRFYEEKAEAIIKENQLMYQLKGSRNIVTYEDHLLVPKEDMPGYDLYIRMELLTPLARHIRDQKLSQADVIKIGVDICRALEELLDHNVIHRDVKLSNIFLDGKGNYKLGDFGVARQMEKSQTFMSKKGTSEYMAPEVFKGERAGKTVDLYALGLVLYRLLNGGRGPFLPEIPHRITPDDLETAQFRRMAGDPLPPPPAANEALAKIVLRACAFRSEDRFKTPADFLEALERYQAGKYEPKAEETADERPADKKTADQSISVEQVDDFGTRQIIQDDGTDAGIPSKVSVYAQVTEESDQIIEQAQGAIEQDNLEQEKRERLERERLERVRLERERLERARLEHAQMERARLEHARLERERTKTRKTIITTVLCVLFWPIGLIVAAWYMFKGAAKGKPVALFALGTLLPAFVAIVMTLIWLGSDRGRIVSAYIMTAMGRTSVFPVVWLAMCMIATVLRRRIGYLAIGLWVHGITAVIAYFGYYRYMGIDPDISWVAHFYSDLMKMYAGNGTSVEFAGWVMLSWFIVEVVSIIGVACWERRNRAAQVYGDA